MNCNANRAVGMCVNAALLLVCVSVSPWARLAQATTYADGGTHTISGADSDVSISNGTTVNVVPGATVTGMSNDPFVFGAAISVNDTASVLNVTGGSIIGGDGSRIGGKGLAASDGHFNISGGTFIGGSSSGFFENRIGGPGVNISTFQSLSVSGGSFTGGLGWPAGSGMQIGASYIQASAYISGGDFYSGASPYGGVFGDGLTIYDRPAGSWSAEISGGTFHGGWGPGPLGSPGLHLVNATVNATGGQSYATMLQVDSVMNVSGSFYAGALEMYDNSIVTLNSGYIEFPDFHDTSVLNMNGGYMTGGGYVADNSVVNLRGGHFGRLDSPESFSQHAVLNVYGTGLTYQNNELHGILQDGTPVDATIWLYDSAVVNLYQIPEPSSLALAAFGFLGLLAWSWRRGHGATN